MALIGNSPGEEQSSDMLKKVRRAFIASPRILYMDVQARLEAWTRLGLCASCDAARDLSLRTPALLSVREARIQQWLSMASSLGLPQHHASMGWLHQCDLFAVVLPKALWWKQKRFVPRAASRFRFELLT